MMRSPAVIPARIVPMLVLLVLLVGGWLVRLIGLTDPPLDGATGRQFHSAFLARRFFVESLPSAAPWQADVARAGAPRLIEPPIVEAAAGAAYRVVGEELLWVPRLLSISAWMLGAVALYGLARALGFRWGALAAVAVYLFAPFAIQFSRNVQPEPLMVSLMIAALWAMVRHDEAPTRRRLALVIVLGAAAGFVKLVSLFVLVGVFAALTIRRLGWRGAIRDGGSWAFLLLVIAPAVAWLAYGFLVAGFLVGQEDGRIVPALLLDPGHWVQTARLLVEVATVPILVLAAIGLVVVPAGRARTFAIGALVGYAAFMVVFTYHTGTHNYYHLQLLPLLALGVGSFVEWLLAAPRLAAAAWLRPVVAVVAVALVVAGSAIGVSRMRPSPQELATIGVAEQVGEAVDHSTRVLAVAERPWPPRPSWYYGWFAGRTWFLDDQVRAALAAGATPDARELLNGAVRRRDDYLAVLDRAQVDAVPGLWDLLRRRYEVVAETPDFVVFDLRRQGPEAAPAGRLSRDATPGSAASAAGHVGRRRA